MVRGVQVDKKRKKEQREVDLITPHGAEITVTPSRAAALLERPPLAFADGTFRKYVEDGESNVVEDSKPATTTAAAPPRRGSGANSGGE